MTPLYHKIQSIYHRDPDNNHKTFIEGSWTYPEFGYLSNLMWEATEKVDGTNCRIHVNPDGYVIGGRTDNAQLHVDLVTSLHDVGGSAKGIGLEGLTLYGEGYGAGIQKGGGYRSDKGFILFDVMVTETEVFLARTDAEDIARKLSIESVPPVYAGSLSRAVQLFREHEVTESRLRDDPIEGWVLRPIVELRTRLGKRVITKIKVKDFPQ